METIVLVVHVLLAIALVVLVLLQQGKGAEAGASFGAGASQTVFGSQGTGSFLGRITGFIAAGIFATSFTLAVYAKHQADSVSDQGIPTAVVEEQLDNDLQVPALEEKAPAERDLDVPVTE